MSRFRELRPLKNRPVFSEAIGNRLQRTLKERIYKPLVDEFAIGDRPSMASRLEAALQRLSPEEISGHGSVISLFDEAIFKIDEDFADSVRAVSIAPEMTEEARIRLATEYSDNIALDIQGWSRAEIRRLRRDVQILAQKGGREAALVDRIQKSYGASRDHARFIAKQETSLFMTKFKQVRYQEIGLPEYVWRCVHMPKDRAPGSHVLGNVRYYHGLLDGKTFRWDTGAPVNAKGEKKNPGQDFRCRCFGAPIVRF